MGKSREKEKGKSESYMTKIDTLTNVTKRALIKSTPSFVAAFSMNLQMSIRMQAIAAAAAAQKLRIWVNCSLCTALIIMLLF